LVTYRKKMIARKRSADRSKRGDPIRHENFTLAFGCGIEQDLARMRTVELILDADADIKGRERYPRCFPTPSRVQ